MGDSAKGRHDMILGRDLIKVLGLNLEFSEHIIDADDGPLKGLTASMVDLGTYEFKILNTWKITPTESFKNTYTEEKRQIGKIPYFY